MFKLLITLLLLPTILFAASSREVDANVITSPDKTLSVTLPTTTGSSGQVLQTNGAGTTSWVSSIPTSLAVTSKTTTYTATTSDDLIFASGSAFTITLYTASGNSGRIIRIKKTDSSTSNIITIDGNASETIDGALTTTLTTQYEEVGLVSDGSNWHTLYRYEHKVTRWIRIANSGTPTITDQDGSWVSSLTDNGTGDVTINIASGVFSSTPVCTCASHRTGLANFCYINSNTAPSTTAYRFQVANDAGGAEDRNIEVQCTGRK